MGMGMSMGTPGTMAALAGVGMSLTLSDLGLGSSGVGGAAGSGGGHRRNEDDERRARTREVLRKIGGAKGRVGEEGIARISRRVGFDNNVDIPSYGGVYGERKVSMAGRLLVVDLEFKNDVPTEVEVLFNSQNEAVAEHERAAGRVLLEDVGVQRGSDREGVPTPTTTILTKLDRFAANLERLAQIDRLSSVQLNCFEALSGVYSSLKRLYDAEKQAVMALLPAATANTELVASRDVLCSRSGRPRIHSHGKIGLRMEYWMKQRHVYNNKRKEADVDAMEVDGDTNNHNNITITDDDDSDGQDAFALRIEVETSSATLYPALRNSDAWLPDQVDLPPSNSAESIPWQEPPPTYLPSETTSSADAMAVDAEQQRQPDLRFVAKLDPPLVMPWQAAVQILQSVGLPEPQILALPPAYHTLLLDSSTAPLNGQVGSGDPVATTQSYVLVPGKDGAETDVKHVNSLFVPKAEFSYAYTLEEIPFSHPRQLVEVLPLLRLWACAGSLLKDAFTSAPPPPSTSPSSLQGIVSGKPDATKAAALLSPPLTPSAGTGTDMAVLIDITLAITPETARFDFIFPASDDMDDSVAEVTLQIGLDARLLVTEQNLASLESGRGVGQGSSDGGIKDEAGDEGKDGVADDMRGIADGHGPKMGGRLTAAMLERCGEIGVWVEWIRGGGGRV